MLIFMLIIMLFAAAMPGHFRQLPRRLLAITPLSRQMLPDMPPRLRCCYAITPDAALMMMIDITYDIFITV